MIDKEGKLLTKKPDIDKQSMEYYKNVLRNRDIKPGLENYKIEREKLCYETLEYTKTVKTAPWTKAEVSEAMKSLKSKKSRDPTNLANEIFNPKVGGDDLVEAVQKLMNRIKRDLIFPDCLNLCNISVYSSKRDQ